MTKSVRAMHIKRLVIENFKSIEKIELDNPAPFTVFVGPNGAGKSNIFESLEFINIWDKTSNVYGLFGGYKTFLRREHTDVPLRFEIDTDEFRHRKRYWKSFSNLLPGVNIRDFNADPDSFTSEERESQSYQQFFNNFTRLFIKNDKLVKQVFKSDDRLSLDASNLEPVLKRLLSNTELRAEIFEWLYLFVPGFKAVEVDDRNELHWFEDSVSDYFTKDLISDGTYNILALLTAVYQSEEPQFLCIEEVENGLHPEVILSLMNFFRKQCEEKGHYIWLNTHSETVVRQLTTDEIVLVNKRRGATEIKQVKGMNIYSLTTDEAWLTGALGGGLTW